MVRQLIRLKAKIMWNTISRQTWVLVMTILGLLYALSILSMIGAGVVFGILAGHEHIIMPMLTFAGGIFILGWWLVPAMFSGMDNTLDPKKFAPYLGPSRKFAFGLSVATGIGVPGIFSTLAFFMPAIGWAVAGQWVSAIAALLLLPLALLTAFTWASAITTWVGVRLQATSTRRDMSTAIATIIFLLVFTPLGVWINWIVQDFNPDFFIQSAEIMGWTPFGAIWGVPASLAQGNILFACLRLLIALVTYACGFWGWSHVIFGAMSGLARPVSQKAQEAIAAGRREIDPHHAQKKFAHPIAGRATSSAKVPNALPRVELWQICGLSAPTASMAARTARYWIRDARLLVTVITVPLFFFMGIMWTRLPGMSSAHGTFFIYMAPVLIGATIGASTQYDSTAFWIPVSSAIKGKHERRGRLFGSLPLNSGILVVCTLAIAFFKGLGIMETLVLLIFLMALLIDAAVVTLIIGSAWVYPVQPPGTSPMSARGTGSFMTTMLTQTATLCGSVIASLPVLVVYILSNTGVLPSWMVVLTGIIWTCLFAHLGLLWAGRIWDRRSVKVLNTIRSWPGH
ncbi:hypothetical protein [Schaalia sp. lx-260]|uniref:hypothetical protein n=1 Tax=Schaalia sp. lx-260 TaxID=2899082 RepID=UPI001E2A0BAE|nr:hypothetical protein [Schaalia sp. lx-260]MCD4550068.1 hypothetical protein [Schaalia sp. lx-260]